MPSIALGYYVTPAVMRLTRAGMLEVLSSDYIRTARAKGLRPFTVLFKHALRNAIIPVVSLAAVQFGFMLGGSIVIETIFQINGLGYLAWESIQRTDLPMMQAIVLVLSVIYVVADLPGRTCSTPSSIRASGWPDMADDHRPRPPCRPPPTRSSRRRRARCCAGASSATGA